MHDIKGEQLEIMHVSWEKNLANLFTKSLGSTNHEELVSGFRMVDLEA
jgi:hypothetical protein